MMRRPLHNLARRLRRDAKGVTALEFALTAPLLLLIMAVLIELGMAYYVQAVLIGTINAAGRASSLQSAQTTSAVARSHPPGSTERRSKTRCSSSKRSS